MTLIGSRFFRLIQINLVLELAHSLKEWGLRGELACIGPSAGVDHILSIVVALFNARRTHNTGFRVTYFIAIAGVYHPTLYTNARELFIEDGTHIIILHHDGDTLCPWPPVQRFWTDLDRAMQGHVFIHTLTCRDRQLVDRNYHNVTKFLCSQANFWSLLGTWHDPQDHFFKQRCTDFCLGEGHLTIGTGTDYVTGYDSDLSDKVHFLQQAMVLFRAMRHAVWILKDSKSILQWIIEMALSAGAIFVPNTQYSKELADFRNCFPDAAADVPWSNRLPRSIFAEALMGLVCGKQPGILKADKIQYSKFISENRR